MKEKDFETDPLYKGSDLELLNSPPGSKFPVSQLDTLRGDNAFSLADEAISFKRFMELYQKHKNK